MTQMELARKAGLPQPMISRIVSGKWKNLTLETVENIFSALGLDVELSLRHLRSRRAANPRTLHSRACFWDVDAKDIRLPDHSFFVAERVLNFGATQEVRWLLSHVSLEVIRDVLRHSRQISPRSRHFWSLFFHFPLPEKYA